MMRPHTRHVVCALAQLALVHALTSPRYHSAQSRRVLLRPLHSAPADSSAEALLAAAADDNAEALLAAAAALRDEAADLEATLPKREVAAAPAEEEAMAVTAPLKFMGPYPAIALRFPELATAAQRERGVKGVSLDFVVDTGANTNTINAQVAKELGLKVVGEREGGVGAGGAIGGGATFLLGDCELDLPERFPFMGGLTASALPGVATPAGAGILGLPFLFSLPGGVEFKWGDEPELTLFGDARGSEDLTDGLCEVAADQLESGLVACTLTVDGVDIPALLDTGSPITVLNDAAARAAGVDVAPPPAAAGGPFAKMKAAAAQAQAAAKGEVVMIGGATGPVALTKVPEPVQIALGAADVGAGRPYVGELPGLAALGGLGADAGPAAVLGADVLRQRARLVLRDGRVFT